MQELSFEMLSFFMIFFSLSCLTIEIAFLYHSYKENKEDRESHEQIHERLKGYLIEKVLSETETLLDVTWNYSLSKNKKTIVQIISYHVKENEQVIQKEWRISRAKFCEIAKDSNDNGKK